MGMIDCPECGGEVSTRAENCPNCGAPVPSHSDDLDGTIQTVEHTSKKYKKHMLIGGAVWLVSLLLLCGVATAIPGDNSFDAMILAALGFWGGLAWAIGAKVLAWWHHG